MKKYSISEVAKQFNLTSHTLRYYDKEGLLPFVERTPSGIRLFKESDMGAIQIIECLKSSGMPIKKIKKFIDWCSEGDSTLQQRYEMFLERKAAVEAQMEELKKTLEVIDYKCSYYKSALDAGTEDIHKRDKEQVSVT
ncbi:MULTISPECIES: MerR family transcriptional regulator [unclassified Bacillus (in: firmicutes)]|uniref:MerR family transcriptional regulator n=1 Tax=unclassified Bacillus (in: firmicutes) TaxID=185979 RepID=UPI0022809410|nr:MerR family transcriptional regulator [Bacillus sp. S20C3]MCY8289640.1 MerR family transcriptional regulator [Bacillus sp. N13C7]MCY8638389.1 MerR family transcriptional regulator [Bacillus sp. S17B2]MCY9144106.1 MerR family transcriptional regulator [Bacillus sp. T9C1]